jgi:hypothetical protein
MQSLTGKNDKRYDELWDKLYDKYNIADDVAVSDFLAQSEGVPNAPWQKTYYLQAMKRMVRYAAENGYDSVSWTPGSVHSNRWGSEKIAWKKADVGYDLLNKVVPSDRVLQKYKAESDALVKKSDELQKKINATESLTDEWMDLQDDRGTTDRAIDALHEKMVKETIDTEDIKGWLVSVKEQVGGNAGMDIEAEADARGLNAQNSKLVTSKDQLRELIDQIASRSRGQYSEANYKAMVDARTDKTWNAMQTQDEGVSLPRKESFEAIYDNKIVNEVNKFFGKKAWGKAKVEKGTIGAPVPGFPTFTKDRTQQVWTLKLTPEMREKSLFEGQTLFKKEEQPSFADTQGPVTDEEVDRYLGLTPDLRAAAWNQFKRGTKAVALGADKILGPIHTRLKNIDEGVAAKFRRLDRDTGVNSGKDYAAVEPMLKKAKKAMDKRDFKLWNYVRMNGDIDRINGLLDKYGLHKEWDAYNAKLTSLRAEGLTVGLDIGLIDNYSPRWVKDYRGFLEAIGKEEKYAPIFQRFDARAKELGVDPLKLTQQEKADILSDMIFGIPKGMGGVSAAKHRVLEKVPPELVQFYAHSDAALIKHLTEMRKAIELRKFFGKIPTRVAEIRSQLKATQSKIRAFNLNISGKITPSQEKAIVKIQRTISAGRDADTNRLDTLKAISEDRMSDELIKDLKKKRNRLIGREKELQAYIDKYATQFDFTPDIISYTLDLVNDGKITSVEDQQAVLDIFKARFVNERGTHGGWSAYKNFSYADTMGSPASALTQVGDIAWAAYEGGLIRALKNVYKSATGKSRITKEDVGVNRIGEEFADAGKMGKAVSFIFKWVGLEKMDSLGKESLLNTAHEMYQKKAKKDPVKLAKEIKGVFGAETQSVIDDLLNDNISDNVKLLVYNRLADFQPIGLSEMPQKYLDAGNGRIFYMLKTFTIKQFDAFRNEAYNKIKNGDRREKIQGMQNLIKLATFFVLANAGADELKDLLLGRKTDLKDRVVDNMLRLGGVSKFITWKARTEGPASAIVRQILPPFKFMDSAGKDIISAGDDKGLEMVGSIPLVGKLAYWHIGRGTHKRDDLWNKRLRDKKSNLNKVKDQYERAEDKIAFRAEHRADLIELRRIGRLQGILNKYRKRINKLKSLEDTKEIRERIQRLELKRTELIKRYLSGEMYPTIKT